MSADTFSEDSTLKITTVARVNATPAAGTAEARKNRQNRRSKGIHIISFPSLITHSEDLHSTEETSNATPVFIPGLPTLTMITVFVPAEAVRVDNIDANTSIVRYSPSEPGDT